MVAYKSARFYVIDSDESSDAHSELVSIYDDLSTHCQSKSVDCITVHTNQLVLLFKLQPST